VRERAETQCRPTQAEAAVALLDLPDAAAGEVLVPIMKKKKGKVPPATTVAKRGTLLETVGRTGSGRELNARRFSRPVRPIAAASIAESWVTSRRLVTNHLGTGLVTIAAKQDTRPATAPTHQHRLDREDRKRMAK